MPAAITDTQPAKRSVGNVSGIDMGISNSIRRAGEYYSRHGLLATIRRAGLGIQRALFASRLVVFYCDLPAQRNRPENVPMSLRIHRLRSEAELGPQGLEKISTFWNPRQARKNIKERFAKGATLWVVKSEEQIAGFGWSLQGSTVEPHYVPLGSEDVHLFDFYVFPDYRGRRINPLLVNYILGHLATDCGGRAYIEAAEWNEAQLNSLQKTPFCRLGAVRSFTIYKHTFISWDMLKVRPESQGRTEWHEEREMLKR